MLSLPVESVVQVESAQTESEHSIVSTSEVEVVLVEQAANKATIAIEKTNFFI